MPSALGRRLIEENALLNRRRLLQGAAMLAFAAGGRRAHAQQEDLPIIFVHGDGDHAPVWQTLIWRFESNGYTRDRMYAVNFAYPLARDDDRVAQANRSSTQDQLAALTAMIETVRLETGAEKVALVAHSRGGYAVRNYLTSSAGAANVARAVLCGTPNHGVYALPDLSPGNEFNGAGPFLKRLNAGDGETPPGVALLTLRSDGYDKYAQADGRYIGHPGVATNVDADGPALQGATNIVLGPVDHRETAFGLRAFPEIYRFIAGREPARIAIAPEAQSTLNGLVTGLADGAPTNLPLAGARVEIYRVARDTGARQGDAVYSGTTGADGVWGVGNVESAAPLEFVVTAPGYPVTHIYRSPFLRSMAMLHLRPAAPLGNDDSGAAAIVTLSRPRGYFGRPRDIVLLDGREPEDITPGVPTDSTATLRLNAPFDRAIVAEFNVERIVARGWPRADGHVTIIEMTS
jgi:pimeloyl-ACP methyl ester carboxylesterase